MMRYFIYEKGYDVSGRNGVAQTVNCGIVMIHRMEIYFEEDPDGIFIINGFHIRQYPNYLDHIRNGEGLLDLDDDILYDTQYAYRIVMSDSENLKKKHTILKLGRLQDE